MTSAWEKFQEQIKEQMREKYSETFIDHNMDPRNVGSFNEADGYGRVTGECGDTMEIWVKVNNNTITKIGFTTDGCGTTLASGSMITELAKNQTLEKARQIEQEDVLDALGGLPEDHEHCALLAATTLKQAIRNYIALTS